MTALSPTPWSLQNDEIRDAQGRLVAQVAEGDGVVWNTALVDDTAQANARALVASPALLKALEEIRSRLSPKAGGVTIDRAGVVAICEEAIALVKVKGGAA